MTGSNSGSSRQWKGVLERDDGASQGFYASVSRERELGPTRSCTRRAAREEERLRDEHGGLDVQRQAA